MSLFLFRYPVPHYLCEYIKSCIQNIHSYSILLQLYNRDDNVSSKYSQYMMAQSQSSCLEIDSMGQICKGWQVEIPKHHNPATVQALSR